MILFDNKYQFEHVVFTHGFSIRLYLILSYSNKLSICIIISYVVLLFSNIDPLRIYVHDEGLTRISTVKYTLKNLKNRFIHLTNYSVNKKNEGVFKAAAYNTGQGGGGEGRGGIGGGVTDGKDVINGTNYKAAARSNIIEN